MPSYTGYRDTVDKARTLFLKGTVQPMAFHIFHEDRGYRVREVLPGDNEQYEFQIGEKLSGVIDTNNRTVYNVIFDGELLSINNITQNPTVLTGFPEYVYTHWEDVLGENRHGASQPNHPGDPPFSIEGGTQMIDALFDEWSLICSDPMLDDLIQAIKEKNYEAAMRFLGADNPHQVLNPTAGHELYNLFSNGDIRIAYSDADVAVLKPEYNHERRAEIIAQQRNARVARRGWFQVTINDAPEEAFIVGRDDTPVGLFIHSVDGTNLNPSDSITREIVHEVMGFDRNYSHSEDKLVPNLNERIRLQGDLAVEYISGDSVDDAGRCYIPIDNHYVALDSGVLPPEETKDEEPIEVIVPEGGVVNISHDEHDNVAVSLSAGRYRFYLLPRGLRRPAERPTWTVPENTESIAV